MDPLPLAQIKAGAQTVPLHAAAHLQLESATTRQTRDGKPFAELVLLDSTDRFTLRVWSDHPEFATLAALPAGEFFALTGEFYRNGNFGLDLRKFDWRPLAEEEKTALLGGPAELREKQAADYAGIVALVESVGDPRLKAMGQAFLADFGERFARSAGARFVHHARRGGLVEHTAQMMRSAHAVASVYPALNRDLLIIGALLHDIGKLWENHIPENSFSMTLDERGELLGHITIGVELVNTLWRKIGGSLDEWKSLAPPSEQVRLHLLHLVASHHGTHEFGSPVVPKTPEAIALNMIDNLDARLEIFTQGYASLPLVAPRIHDKVKPMNHHLVAPLPTFHLEEDQKIINSEKEEDSEA